MNELVEEYLKDEYGEIDIRHSQIDGHNLYVKFVAWGGYDQTEDINIWDMLVFLNKRWSKK